MPRVTPKKLSYVFDNSPYLNNPEVDRLRKQVASEVLARRVKQSHKRAGCEPKVVQDVRNKRYHHAHVARRSAAEAEAILCAALRAIA